MTRHLSHVSATMPGMTPTPPAATPTTRPPSEVALPPAGGVGPGDSLWFLAACERCGSDLAEPFRNQSERDHWAIAHLLGTGHTVNISVDGVPAEAHLTAYLRRTEDGAGFKWLCPGDAHPAWIGNYETPQLAIADWRGHSGVSVR